MIGQWGMDDIFGMAVIREKDAVCSDVESRLRERVNAILQQMLGETVAKIKNNKESVDLLAEVLFWKTIWTAEKSENCWNQRINIRYGRYGFKG